VLDPVYHVVSALMWFWHEVFALLLGPASGIAWALSVVFLVLTLRAVMIKPFLSQVRSGRVKRALAPQLAELRTRHAADPARLVRESRALQSAHGVSTLGSVLPALLQLPVFLGLLHVLRCFNRSGLSFEQNASIPNYAFAPDEVRSFLQARLFGAPLSSYVTMPQELLDSFGAHVERGDVVAVAVPLMLLAAFATHFSARHALRLQPLEGPVAAVMVWMPWVVPMGVLVSGAFFPFPVAILLYWLTNNAWTLVQQHLAHRTEPVTRAAAAATPARDAPLPAVPLPAVPLPAVPLPAVPLPAVPPRTRSARSGPRRSGRRRTSGPRPRRRR